LSHFTLFVSFFNEKKTERLKEYESCFLKNIENHFIKEIHVSYEYLTNSELETIKSNIPSFLKHKKVKLEFVQKNKPRDFSYLYFIKKANRVLDSGEKFIIANTDIYFDESLEAANNTDFSKITFALTRYNFEPYLNMANVPWERNIGSQDSWFMQTPFPESPQFDLNLGWIGCDNRIAYELDKAGYMVLNPSLTIKTWHIHKETFQKILYKKYSYRHSGKPYKFLPFISLEDIQKQDFIYVKLSAHDRKMIEWMLSMYKRELGQVVNKPEKKNIAPETKNNAPEKKNNAPDIKIVPTPIPDDSQSNVYSGIGKMFRKIKSQRLQKMFIALGSVMVKVGKDLNNVYKE